MQEQCNRSESFGERELEFISTTKKNGRWGTDRSRQHQRPEPAEPKMYKVTARLHLWVCWFSLQTSSSSGFLSCDRAPQVWSRPATRRSSCFPYGASRSEPGPAGGTGGPRVDPSATKGIACQKGTSAFYLLLVNGVSPLPAPEGGAESPRSLLARCSLSGSIGTVVKLLPALQVRLFWISSLQQQQTAVEMLILRKE